MDPASKHLELRVTQRTRHHLSGREIHREEILTERCLPDGRLLSAEMERRTPGGALTRRRLWQEGTGFKLADAPRGSDSGRTNANAKTGIGPGGANAEIGACPGEASANANAKTGIGPGGANAKTGISPDEASAMGEPGRPEPSANSNAITITPPKGAPVMGHCALWIAFVTLPSPRPQPGAPRLSSPERAESSPIPRRLLTLDLATGALRPGLLFPLPPTAGAGPGPTAGAGPGPTADAGPGPTAGAGPGPTAGAGPAFSSSTSPSAARFRFADAEDPGVHTDFHLGPSGVPELLRVRGVAAPLTLTLATKAQAEAALSTQRRSDDELHLTLDVGARLPEPTTLKLLRYALQLPAPLPAEAARALDEGQQRRLEGGAEDAFTIEVVSPDLSSPALAPAAALPFPLPQSQIPEGVRGYLHPRLAPALPPRDPARRALAEELAETTTALDAALRLTSWAASPLADHAGKHQAARAGARQSPRPSAHQAARARARPTDSHGDIEPGSAALSYPAPERLVAALRAVGLPARIAYGLLYVGSVAIEHRWVEVHLTRWLPLDPELGGLAGASHLRLSASPLGPPPTPDAAAPSQHPGPDDALQRDPSARWQALRRSTFSTSRFRLRLLEAILPSGLRFSPGGALNAQITANQLSHRAWGFVLRRPLAPETRFVLGGAADDFEAQVAGTSADLRLTLRLYAASAEGLDARAFIAQGYRFRQIGNNAFLVKDLSPSQTRLGKDARTSPAQGQGPGAVHRSYLQLACAPGPWRARLVRFTLEARGAAEADLDALERTALGSFQMTGRHAGASSCPSLAPAREDQAPPAREDQAPPAREAPARQTQPAQPEQPKQPARPAQRNLRPSRATPAQSDQPGKPAQ
jgi:hypothetical protein